MAGIVPLRAGAGLPPPLPHPHLHHRPKTSPPGAVPPWIQGHLQKPSPTSLSRPLLRPLPCHRGQRHLVHLPRGRRGHQGRRVRRGLPRCLLPPSHGCRNCRRGCTQPARGRHAHGRAPIAMTVAPTPPTPSHGRGSAGNASPGRPEVGVASRDAANNARYSGGRRPGLLGLQRAGSALGARPEADAAVGTPQTITTSTRPLTPPHGRGEGASLGGPEANAATRANRTPRAPPRSFPARPTGEGKVRDASRGCPRADADNPPPNSPRGGRPGHERGSPARPAGTHRPQ